MEQLKNPMVEAHEGDDDLVDSSSSSSSSLSGISSGSSMDYSDSSEDVTSNATSSSSSDHPATEPLSDMSALFQQLPIKKGLSRHYEGKSRSFTSLGSVRSLEDVVKPEKAYSKKLKSCRRSYGGGLCSPINAMSRQICKKGWHSSSRSLCCSSSSSMSARRNSVNCMSSRPPIPPHRSTTMSNQTALFA